MSKHLADHHATMLYSAMALVQNPIALRTMREAAVYLEQGLTAAHGEGAQAASESVASGVPVPLPAVLTDGEAGLVFMNSGIPNKICAGQNIDPKDWFDYARAIQAYVLRQRPGAAHARYTGEQIAAVVRELESRGWCPDRNGDPECEDEACAMAADIIVELQRQLVQANSALQALQREVRSG